MHQISTRTALEPYLPQFFAYCPTMDLVATVTRKGGVDVWRLNGQRVFGANFAKDEDDDDFGEQAERDELQDEGGNVKAIAWRRDGEFCSKKHFPRLAGPNILIGVLTHQVRYWPSLVRMALCRSSILSRARLRTEYRHTRRKPHHLLHCNLKRADGAPNPLQNLMVLFPCRLSRGQPTSHTHHRTLSAHVFLHKTRHMEMSRSTKFCLSAPM